MKTEANLIAACRELAISVLHNYEKPEHITEIWSTEDREQLAQELFEVAESQIEYVGEDGDPELVVRAVRYIAVHAIPPHRMSIEWFKHGLEMLVVLACPCYHVPVGGEPFFEDIRRGMRNAESNLGDE